MNLSEMNLAQQLAFHYAQARDRIKNTSEFKNAFANVICILSKQASNGIRRPYRCQLPSEMQDVLVDSFRESGFNVKVHDSGFVEISFTLDENTNS